MSTLIRAQLMSSLRASVKELDDKIALTERDIAEFTFAVPRRVRTDRHALLKRLADERDAIIARIEEAEEADDLMWSLVCAIQDASDCDPLTAGSLAAQLENYGLVVSRAVKPVKCSRAEAYIIPIHPLPRG